MKEMERRKRMTDERENTRGSKKETQAINKQKKKVKQLVQCGKPDSFNYQMYYVITALEIREREPETYSKTNETKWWKGALMVTMNKIIQKYTKCSESSSPLISEYRETLTVAQLVRKFYQCLLNPRVYYYYEISRHWTLF